MWPFGCICLDAVVGMCLGGLFLVLPWSLTLPIPDNVCPLMCPSFVGCVPRRSDTCSQPPAFSWWTLSTSVCSFSADPLILWLFLFSFLVGCRCCTLLPGTRPSLATPTPSDLSSSNLLTRSLMTPKICVCTHDAYEYIVCFPSWD